MYTRSRTIITKRRIGKEAANYCLAAGEEANRTVCQLFSASLVPTGVDCRRKRRESALTRQFISPSMIIWVVRIWRSNNAKKRRLFTAACATWRKAAAILSQKDRLCVNWPMYECRLYQSDLAEKTACEALKLGEQTGDLWLVTSAHAQLGNLLYHARPTRSSHVHFEESSERRRGAG